MNNYQHEHVHLLIWNGNLWSVWFRARRNWVGSNNFQKIDFHEVMTATEGDICYNQIKISSFRSQSSNYIYGKRNVEREKESKKKERNYMTCPRLPGRRNKITKKKKKKCYRRGREGTHRRNAIVLAPLLARVHTIIDVPTKCAHITWNPEMSTSTRNLIST